MAWSDAARQAAAMARSRSKNMHGHATHGVESPGAKVKSNYQQIKADEHANAKFREASRQERMRNAGFDPHTGKLNPTSTPSSHTGKVVQATVMAGTKTAADRSAALAKFVGGGGLGKLGRR